MFLLSEGTNLQRLSVYLGKNAINETNEDREQTFTVEKVIIHQKFNESDLNNDIGVHCCSVCMCTSEKDEESVCRTHRCVCLCISALVKIRSRNGGCAVRSASVRTVCLPPFHTELPAGFQCSIAGFGRERYSECCRTFDLQIHD